MGGKSHAFGVNLQMQMNVVVHIVFAEKREQSAGAVVAAELRAVEFELRLAGEMICIRSGNHG